MNLFLAVEIQKDSFINIIQDSSSLFVNQKMFIKIKKETEIIVVLNCIENLLNNSDWFSKKFRCEFLLSLDQV